MSKIKRILGENIKKIRRAKNFTQVQLSEIVGMDFKNLSRIETGHIYPGADNIEVLAKALDVEVWELFYTSGKISSEEMRKEINIALDCEETLTSMFLYLKCLKY